MAARDYRFCMCCHVLVGNLADLLPAALSTLCSAQRQGLMYLVLYPPCIKEQAQCTRRTVSIDAHTDSTASRAPEGLSDFCRLVYDSDVPTGGACAEQAVDPARDLPIALFTSLGVSTVLYTLMACAITLMVPYQLINIQAPFSVAFHTAHEPWVAQLVSIGAVVAIGTVLLVHLPAMH